MAATVTTRKNDKVAEDNLLSFVRRSVIWKDNKLIFIFVKGDNRLASRWIDWIGYIIILFIFQYVNDKRTSLEITVKGRNIMWM